MAFRNLVHRLDSLAIVAYNPQLVMAVEGSGQRE